MNSHSTNRFWSRVAVCTVLMACSVAMARATLKVGDAFPDLAGFPLEGKRPNPGTNQVVLLDFWASWCTPCAQSFPVLEELHKKYKERGLVIVAVSTDEKAAKMEAFLKKHPVTFTVVRDAEQKLVSIAEVTAMPTSVLVDRHGKIRFLHNGFRGEETKKQYIAEIESLLKGDQ